MSDLILNLRIGEYHLQLNNRYKWRWSHNPYWVGRVTWRNYIELLELRFW